MKQLLTLITLLALTSGAAYANCGEKECAKGKCEKGKSACSRHKSGKKCTKAGECKVKETTKDGAVTEKAPETH
jgi:hypothetical protein